MRKPNTLHLDEWRAHSLHEPHAADEKWQQRRVRMTAAFLGPLVVGVLAGGVYLDQTELHGTVTDGIGHEMGVWVHEAAQWGDAQLQWVEDHTPEH